MQGEAGQFLSSAHAQGGSAVPLELRRPLSGPADHDEHAAAGPFHIPEGKLNVGGFPARRGKLLHRVGSQRLGQRLVAGGRAKISPVIVERELTAGRAGESGIDGLDVGKDRRVPVARIPEVERPFDRRELPIPDADTTEDQARLGVGVGERVLRSLPVERASRPGEHPGLEQFR